MTMSIHRSAPGTFAFILAGVVFVSLIGFAPAGAKADGTDYEYTYDFAPYNYGYDYGYDYAPYSYGYDYTYDYGYYYEPEPYYYDYSNYGYYYEPYPYYADYGYYYEPYYYDYGYSYQQPYYDYSYDYSYDYYYEYEYVYETPKPKPQPQAKQPVCDIEASRTRIERGQSTTLTWDSQYASSASLSSFGSVSTSGSRSVSPTSDRTYTLSVSGNGGSDTCSVTIRVEEEEEEAPWCELRVSPTRIEDGERATLRWETENATYASINQGVGRVDEDGGSERVSPSRDTTYRMTVRNSDGDEETCSATLRVDRGNDFSSVTFTGDPVNNPPVVYLSNLPYTGLEDLSPSMWGSLAALVALLGVGGYLVFVRRQAVV